MLVRVVFILLLLMLPLVVQAQEQTPPVEPAQQVIQMLVDGDYTGVYDQFTDQIKGLLTAARLQQAWEQIVAGAGAFQQITNVQEDAANGAVTLTLQFERAALDAHIAYDAEGRLAALNFTPVAAASQPTLVAPTPAYADQNSFTETDVTVGEFDLPGTITMPNGSGLFPAVVLISGSGPNDRDETVGPNKPFRDIAWGLATQGIATLRFDKRTFAAKASLDLAHFTVKEEYVDDAVAAVELLRQTDGIDPARVFILGHSLGGYVAPRIASVDPNIAGVIIASGLALPLPEKILAQNRYILSLGSQPADQQQATLDAIQSVIDQINALTPDSPTDTLLLAAPPAYWLDLRDYDPPALAAALPQPILVLQGGRDYQVTVEDDLALWQASLADHSDTTFRTYPDLNHIYVTGAGRATPGEYELPGTVAPEVIDDIAAWVKAH